MDMKKRKKDNVVGAKGEMSIGKDIIQEVGELKTLIL